MALPITQITELTADQIDQYVTVNEAFRALEALSFRVLSDSTDAEPGSPSEGDAYIITASATGTDWGTFTANDVAIYVASAWINITPFEGLCLWVNDEDLSKVYDGSNWITLLNSEGTSTLTAAPNTSGTITLNTTFDTIAYTKIGREVLISGQVRVSSVSSPVGTQVDFSGLPFTSADLDELSNVTAVMCHMYDGTNWTPQAALISEATSVISVFIDASTVTSNHRFVFNTAYKS